MTLTVREHMALKLAATPYRYPAIRATHARELLGYNEIQFWAVVARLLERADAEATHPADVRRLRRISQRRAEARSARRLPGSTTVRGVGTVYTAEGHGVPNPSASGN